MARCEDFPCCGHESGCCPDFVDGVQVNMICMCGAVLLVDNPSSLCDGCLRDPDDPREFEEEEDDDEDFEDEDFEDDDEDFEDDDEEFDDDV